ncbi:putative Transmembrane protein [Melia azedarach]|uniref:Transmembrane protein n=1 Tax=Melia azedarach TaxID=155640 RepID=A0ACC1XEF8_MELAZ|nr:putative Transmembrane protein [Melia azedarach]
MIFLAGKSSFLVLALLLVSLSSISAFSQDRSSKDALKFILGGTHNLGPWKNEIYDYEEAEAPGPAKAVPLLLAATRTKRPDILNHFRRYRGGWDITNKHYWASVGFTGAAAFILAVVWFVLFGLVLVVHHCCGWRINMKGKGSARSQRICLILLILFTCVAAIGCILLSVGQDDFHGEVLHTLKYVVNQSDYTVQTLRNVTEYLSLAKSISVAQVFLPSNVMDDIDKLNVDLSTAADTLAEKTSENSAEIKKVFNAVRFALITVAALMLLLSIIGLFLSILGHKHSIHIFIVSGWLLVAITFILCGVFVILNSAISDTCMAMEEWVDNPHAETALSNILPCVDQKTTNQTLIQSKQVITDIVNVVNQFIYNIANGNPSQDYPYYYNQSGPVMPPLCYPFDSQLQDRQCGSYEVSIGNASEVWQNYTCKVSAAGVCTSVGRVTLYFYKELVSAVKEIYALQHYTPPLLSLQDCNFVRDTFQNITSNYCPPLEHYLKIVNAGLGLISAGVLLCLLLWILYANRPQREEVFAKLPLPIKCISRSQNNSVNNSSNNHVSSSNPTSSEV